MDTLNSQELKRDRKGKKLYVYFNTLRLKREKGGKLDDYFKFSRTEKKK